MIKVKENEIQKYKIKVKGLENFSENLSQIEPNGDRDSVLER